MTFKLKQTARGKESNLKKYRIKIFTHVMNNYIVVVLASYEYEAAKLEPIGDPAIRSIAFLGRTPNITMGETVSYVINQSKLHNFKNVIVEDGGFYFNDKLIRIEHINQDYRELLAIGIDRYVIIPS